MINFKKPTQPTTNKLKTNRGENAPPLLNWIKGK